VPSDPRAGDAAVPARGPLPAPAVTLGDHDASPRVGSWTRDRQESGTPLDAKDGQERHVSAASIPSSEYVGSSALSSAPNPVPEAIERASNRVERAEGETNARRGRDGEVVPAGRGGNW
jgi:hypothetical protein